MKKFSGQPSETGSEFVPGMPVRVKNTADKTVNHEYLPNGITGLVHKIENGKVYVAYMIPGKGIKSGQEGKSNIFPFDPQDIEEVKS
jgi:hypothetical protein